VKHSAAFDSLYNRSWFAAFSSKIPLTRVVMWIGYCRYGPTDDKKHLVDQLEGLTDSEWENIQNLYIDTYISKLQRVKDDSNWKKDCLDWIRHLETIREFEH